MDRRFDNIGDSISKQNRSFKNYLKDFLLDSDSWNLLTLISKQTNVYIFSGVIRNFLLGYLENRDLDIVIDNIDDISIPHKYLNKIDYKRNSFGGYKLKVGKIVVDMWELNNTWGIQKLNLKNTPYSLIRTAFFNFSSIVYDFNNERFIYDESFLEFFKIPHAMDIRYKENPNVPLCIINTFYYSLKYSFPIKYRLCKWVVEHYDVNINFENIQLNHFKRIIFSNDDICQLIKICSDSLLLLRKSKINNAILLKKID